MILGGQGGDEIFGGYTRYLIAYFEQCIKAAIDGTMHSGNFVVTYESIIPNLVALRNYKPLLKEFWRDGLFEDLDARYFRLINRAPHLSGEVDFEALGDYSPFETFQSIFNGRNVGHESYFDKMTHFDFKTLLPALLQVEDRVSMAHGLESRVPLLDHELVELAATMPADVKFKGGTMKHVFKQATRPLVPDVIADRKDKMGFPVPLHEWFAGPAREFVADVFSSQAAPSATTSTTARCSPGSRRENRFGRKTWGLLCLELWQRLFHDREHEFKSLLTTKGTHHEGADHRRGRLHRLPPRRPPAGRRPRGARHRQLRDRAPRQPDRARRPDDRRGHDRRPRRGREAFEGFQPDVVVHAAASYKDPDDWAEDVRTNALGTANVVRAAQATGVERLIYFQTALCYGTQPMEQPITLEPPDPPRLELRDLQDGGRAVHRAVGLDFVSFRLANAYGPRNISGPLPTFFQRLTDGKPCFVMDTRRDFIYVDDLIDVVVQASSTARATGTTTSRRAPTSRSRSCSTPRSRRSGSSSTRTSRCARAARTTPSRSCSTLAHPARTSAGQPKTPLDGGRRQGDRLLPRARHRADVHPPEGARE